MSDVEDFFEAKHPWSRYKDGILDYYLRPYLGKVARLGRPITVVDCFAGAGRFGDGERGSPLIVLDHLQRERARGVAVQGIFVEKVPSLVARLRAATAPYGDLAIVLEGDFRDHLGMIEERARGGTVFVYADPIKPTDLAFEDLGAVYHAIREGKSVEALVNFLSSGFVRMAQGLLGEAPRLPAPELQRRIDSVDRVAGGRYWDAIVRSGLSTREIIDAAAGGYAGQLQRWFRYVLGYPIRERYEDEQPKYHLVFGSRWPDAVDLMNRAMVSARRKFVGAAFVEGRLFNETPEEEVPNEEAMSALLVSTLDALGPTDWRTLRVEATLRDPCRFTDAELNAAIKSAIVRRRIQSDVDGSKIVEGARIWPMPGTSPS